MKEVVRYEISGDKIGLLAYFEDGSFYHIHRNVLTKLERWILNLILLLDKASASTIS